MISKILFLVLLGTALVLANPVEEHSEVVVVDPKDARDIIEIDETGNTDAIQFITEAEEVVKDAEEDTNLPSFSTPEPTPEPPVSEQEIPEDKTEDKPEDKPDTTTEPKENPSIKEKIEQWFEGAEQKWNEHIEDTKETIKDAWQSWKNKWSKWTL